MVFSSDTKHFHSCNSFGVMRSVYKPKFGLKDEESLDELAEPDFSSVSNPLWSHAPVE